jgi:hypothetical protein
MKRSSPVIAATFWIISFASLLQGQTQRVEITRDTWLSNYADEAKGSNGGSSRLKLKSIQEISIVDFDPEPFRGRTIKSAKLWLRSSGEPHVDRITISTITAEWFEGDSQSYAIKDGFSTFSHRVYPTERWADSDVTAVSIGNGGSMWKSVQGTKPDADGWIQFDVPPSLIAARVAGVSYGLLLMDDTGSEWKREGENFEFRLFPNRFVFSRDSNRQSAPFLEIELGESDNLSPAPPREARYEKSTPTDPRSRVTWSPVTDAIGYKVHVQGAPIPQHFVPAAKSDDIAELICDPLLPIWNSQSKQQVEIFAVDAAGNMSTHAKVEIPATEPAKNIAWNAAPSPVKQAENQSWPDSKLGNCSFAVIDPLDKYLPISKRLLPAARDNYFLKNAIWDSPTQSIRLDAARGQWIGFQLIGANAPTGFEFEWNLPTLTKSRLEVARYEYIEHEGELLADPLVPLSTGKSQASGRLLPSPKHAATNSWLFECWIDSNAKPGSHQGELILKSGKAQARIQITIQVHRATIPDDLSFLPEMNCYDLPANDRDYYRLAHRHRVVLNRVPYYQNGRVADGFVPTVEGDRFDWTAWDTRFAQYFDGSAFSDLPRGPVPLECFYLPMHENWPSSMEENYRGGYWADEAFPESYRKKWKDTATEFSQHIADRGWEQTRFHVYLNNKIDFKQRGWSRGSSVWLLDEPANFQDFIALRYFAAAFREGRSAVSAKNQVMFRADISRPQWQRDTLDGLLDYNVVSQSAFRSYPRLVMDRKLRENQLLMIYGSTNSLNSSNTQSVAWSWDVWCRGGDGVLPWQTIGTEQSWSKPDELSLFYPRPSDPKLTALEAGGAPKNDNLSPFPSIRLKAYCYGQQDAELLSLWARSMSIDRYSAGKQLLEKIGLRAIVRPSGEYTEDAGWSDYGQLSPETFTEYRRELLRHLDEF